MRCLLRLIPNGNKNVSIEEIKKIVNLFKENEIISVSNVKMKVTKSMPKYVSPISYILEGIEFENLNSFLEMQTQEDTFALIFHPGKNAQKLFSFKGIDKIVIDEIAIDGYGDISPSGLFTHNIAVILEGKINKDTYLHRLKNEKSYLKISNEIAEVFNAKKIEIYLEEL
ncbi:MAG: hypothetical protein QXT63_00745 [Thermoplasmata archaeon]